jgi:hypothetical protein
MTTITPPVIALIIAPVIASCHRQRPAGRNTLRRLTRLRNHWDYSGIGSGGPPQVSPAQPRQLAVVKESDSGTHLHEPVIGS